jgi:hypothetical protein
MPGTSREVVVHLKRVHAAKKSELVVGWRAVVKTNTHGKTAASVKISAPAKK